MRTTINIEDELLDKAAKLTGVREKTSLVRLGFEALVVVESAWNYLIGLTLAEGFI